MTQSTNGGWIGVDLDGTLAYYDGWVSETHIGEPILRMVNRVKSWIDQGYDVRIFTARVCEAAGRDIGVIDNAIKEWCRKHIGRVLPVTNQKDFNMIELWDDRCVQVESNTGIVSSDRCGIRV